MRYLITINKSITKLADQAKYLQNHSTQKTDWYQRALKSKISN